jgi:hypothetical protein
MWQKLISFIFKAVLSPALALGSFPVLNKSRIVLSYQGLYSIFNKVFDTFSLFLYRFDNFEAFQHFIVLHILNAAVLTEYFFNFWYEGVFSN